MAEISFAVLLSKNVKQKPLYLEQIEAVVEITGEKPDSLTLQQIRDEKSLEASFKDRRTNINRLYDEYVEKLEKAADEKAAEKLVDEFNDELKKEVQALEKQLKTRVDKFLQEQKKDKNSLFWAKAKLTARVVWAYAKLIKGALELGAKIGAVVSTGGVFLTLVAAKALYSSLNDLKDTWDKLDDAFDEERQVFAKFTQAVTEMKAIKSPNPIPQSKMDEVQRLLGAYGGKLLGAEATAREMAVELDKLLAKLDKAKFRKPARQKAIEDAVDALVKDIHETMKNVGAGRKKVEATKNTIRDVAKRVQADPTTFWTIAAGFYKVMDYMMDMGEEAWEVKGLASQFKKCLEVAVPKMRDEMLDAEVDERTK